MLELNKVHNMDCIEGMKLLDDDTISVCITDPPYDYEVIGQTWNNKEIERRLEKIKSDKESTTLVKNIPYGNGLAGGIRNKRWYERNRESTLNYEKWTEEWGRELFRVMKSGGLAFVFNSSRSVAHTQVALENVGFYARDIIVWRRNSGIPKGLNVAKKLQKLGREDYKEWEGWHSCFRSEWEAICVVQKPLINNYIETLEKNNIGLLKVKSDEGFKSNIIENIQRDKKDEFNNHVTVKPTELIKELLEISVPKGNNVVLDCFMGSGTTALCCKEKGIDYIGFEINKEYCDIIEKRLDSINQIEG